MRQIILNLWAILLAFPVATLADICPEKPPATKHYAETVSCPAAAIKTEGQKYAGDHYDWDCFSLVPVTNETVSYSSAKHNALLPSVNSLLPAAEKDFKSRIWMVSEVQCGGNNKVTVRYWGGGNCTRCVQQVLYRFSADGKLEEAKLK